MRGTRFDVSSSMLQFKPIDLSAHTDHSICFREDSFVCSFGNASKFNSTQYTDWLKAKLKKDPWFGVHVWLDDQLIGQMELGPFKQDEPGVSYINLYYLIPEMRGKGFSALLDQYAMTFFKGRGFSKAYLSVSPSNPRAIRYYTRMGWLDRGAKPETPDVILMEKQIF